MVAIKKPDLKELTNDIKTTFNNAIPELDLTNKNAMINALLCALAGSSFTHNALINNYYNDNRISTASEDGLTSYGVDMNIPRIEARASSGNIVFPSIESKTTIEKGTEFLINGYVFISSNETSLQNLTTEVETSSYDSLTGVTTITTKEDNYLIKDLFIKVDSIEYSILLVSNSKTFTINGDVTAVFKENTIIDYSVFVINVTSKDLGSNQNVISYIEVTSNSLQDIKGYTSYKGITGGLDTETNDSYRSRLINAKSSLNKGVYGIDGFNRLLAENQLDYQYVLLRASDELTTKAGYSTIYILKKDNSLLSQSELDNVIDLLFNYNGGLIYPTETKEDNRTKVLNATLIKQDFVITALNPDYTSVREAINNSLEDFFKNEVKIGTPIRFGEYYNAIIRAIDNAGNQVISFKVSNITEDIDCKRNERIVLGNITYE